MNNIVRLLIVEDHQLVLDGIAALLKDEPSINVVGLAENGNEALEKAKVLLPDVVLMDIGMPIMDGFEATRQFQTTLPDVRILIISMHDEPEYIMRVMREGAAGYVLKNISACKLIQAINTVHQGISVFPALRQVPKTDNVLTQRETDVLVLLVKGTANGSITTKAIARELDIGVRTVESHRQNIYSKLNLRTPLELVEYARKYGLV